MNHTQGNLTPIGYGDDAIKAIESFDAGQEMNSLQAKVVTLRNENEWLREEVTRLMDLAFDRAAEIAALSGDEEE